MFGRATIRLGIGPHSSCAMSQDSTKRACFIISGTVCLEFAARACPVI